MNGYDNLFIFVTLGWSMMLALISVNFWDRDYRRWVGWIMLIIAIILFHIGIICIAFNSFPSDWFR